MRRLFIYMLIACVFALVPRISLARDTERIPTPKDLVDVFNPNIKSKLKPNRLVEFDPLKFIVAAGYTYVIPIPATGCEAIEKDGFKFKSARIDPKFVDFAFKQRNQRAEGIDVPIIIKTCIVMVEVTIPRSLGRGTHELIYAPTGDVVATIKVRDRESHKIIDLRKK